jgi:bla regulator protein BlaR1
MVPYLFKSIVCLGIFLLVYLLFLEKEKMHRFNRWYLLGSILFAFFVPLVSFTVTQESLPVLQNNYFAILDQPATALLSKTIAPTVAPVISSTASLVDYVMPALLVIYLLITLVLLTRFAGNIYRLLSAAASNKTVSYRGANLVLLKEETASYSFLNYIFISERDYANSVIEDEIITHELTHVNEKHSWDVIFIELLQIIFWFNPMFLLYKKAIQLNHEYLADEAVIRTYADVPAYQYLLLDKASCACNAQLTSNFNYSVTKKRLIMLTKTTNHIRTFLKKIAIVPLLAAAVFVFSVKNIIAQQTEPVKQKSPGLKDKKAGPPLSVFGNDVPVTSTIGLSDEQWKEYNSIIDGTVKKNDKGTVTSSGHGVLMPHVTFKGTPEQRKTLFELYKQMNAQQRHDARIMFMKRWDGPKKSVPTDEQFQKWKDPAGYGVWIDGKKISNDVLDKYQASDFSHYALSSLAYNEEQKQHIMKIYNLKIMYKVQLNLTTHAAFEKDKAYALTQPEYGLFYHTTRDEKANRDVEWRMMVKEL